MTDGKTTVDRKNGFTIVELLVVIIVIGILASLAVVSYGAWQQGLAKKVVQSDLKQVASAMESGRNFSSTGYPTDVPASYKASPDVRSTYVSGSSTDYCIDGASKKFPTIGYFITPSNKEPRLGTCDGGVGAVAMTPYQDVIGDDAPSAYCRFNDPARTASTTTINCGGLTVSLDGDRCTPNEPMWNTQQTGLSPSNKSLQLTTPTCGQQYSHYSNTGQSTVQNNINQWSSEIWVKFNGTATNKAIISAENQWGMRSTATGFACDHRSNVPVNSVSSAAVAPTVGSWFHIVCTYDSGVLKLYVNGTERASSTFANGSSSSVNNLHLGSYNSNWAANGADQLSGYVDEFAFYKNKTLSAAEVSERYSYHP